MAMARVMPKKVQFIGTASVRCNSNRPTQLVTGPGKTGKNEPMIPSKATKKPTMSKKISICECMF